MATEVRDKLAELIKKFGTSLSEDESKLRAILKDILNKEEHLKSVNILLLAVREGIPKDLNNSSIPAMALIPQLIKRLIDNLGMEQSNAQWVVETWAYALGVNYQNNTKTKIKVKGKSSLIQNELGNIEPDLSSKNTELNEKRKSNQIKHSSIQDLPKINYFSVDKHIVKEEEKIYLAWDIENVDSVFLLLDIAKLNLDLYEHKNHLGTDVEALLLYGDENVYKEATVGFGDKFSLCENLSPIENGIQHIPLKAGHYYYVLVAHNTQYDKYIQEIINIEVIKKYTLPNSELNKPENIAEIKSSILANILGAIFSIFWFIGIALFYGLLAAFMVLIIKLVFLLFKT